VNERIIAIKDAIAVAEDLAARCKKLDIDRYVVWDALDQLGSALERETEKEAEIAYHAMTGE
jgi:hypothetical protein